MRIAVMGLFLAVVQLAFAEAPLFVPLEKAGERAAVAGTYNIAALNNPATADTVQIYFYGDSGCTAVQLSNNFTGGDGFTFNPGTTVGISAAGIYQLAQNSSVDTNATAAVAVNPLIGATGIFTSWTCFPVVCSASQCVGSDVENVTLAP